MKSKQNFIVLILSQIFSFNLSETLKYKNWVQDGGKHYKIGPEVYDSMPFQCFNFQDLTHVGVNINFEDTPPLCSWTHGITLYNSQ